MERLLAHLVTLPRWFALPAAACAIALGCILGEVEGWLMALVIVCGAFLMAWSHSMNTFLDYVWTGFDKGGVRERSREKSYTSGQQPIATGLMDPLEVFLNAYMWLFLAVVCAIVITLATSSVWIWLPFTLIALSTFFYSWGKLHYMCELALGLGFGSFAVMLGMCASGNPDLILALWAGLPFAVLWGFAAETYDQWDDAEPNWQRGLRNLGALTWKYGVSIAGMVLMLVAMSYLVQMALVIKGMIAPETLLSLFAIPMLVYGAPPAGGKEKIGVLILLMGIFAHMILFTVGQALS